ncbi:BRCT domain-containing protein [Marinomonas posidonica]|uniref:BRCT domain-containing protein n=1 Tax=Marinomonas posidonica TaxID=936476 RepID=UPI0037368BFB
MDSSTPNYARASNKKKAIYSLKGILQGVVADTKLNTMEALYLNTWLLDSKPLRDDPDAQDLLDLISDALVDGQFTAEELDDLNALITDIIEFRSFEDVTESDYLNEFLGLVSGIVADDQINAEEFEYLIDWINRHSDIMDDSTIRSVAAKLMEFSELQQPTPTDEESLLSFLKQTAGIRFLETGAADAHPMDHIADRIDSMNHERAAICFTGVFNTGTRKEVEAIAIKLGATPRKDPSKSIHYVVIGSQVSPDWKHTSFGRKIQKAIELRESGHPLIILTEQEWIRFI